MTFEELHRLYPGLCEYTQNIPPSLRRCDTVRKLPPGHLIHQKDSVLQQVGFLCEGTLKVINEFDNGNAFMIEHNKPIDVIGDVTLLSGREKTSVTIETVTACTVWFFEREDFARWLETDCHLLRVMARRVAGKLYNSSYSRGAEVFYSSPRLMLEFLRRYAAENPPAAGASTRVADTRQQLAERLGMTQKTVDRTVRKLKDGGLLGLERGKITVDEGQLAAIHRRLDEWLA